jgi:pimeloyl-ACP methyl ester carboxylesterase
LDLIPLILYIFVGLVATVTLGFFTFWVVIVYNYLKYVTRIFQERPIFSIPRGVPSPDAEDLVVPTIDGQNLKACYLSSLVEGTRKGVVLFGIEFGSNRWSCQHHAEFLRRAGYDVLSWEPRGQGESDKIPGYTPLHWVSEHEVADALAIVEYACRRPDADPRGVGLVGLSKGAGAGVVAASRDRRIRCCVTDGMFAVYTTVVPYMRHWVKIYSRLTWVQKVAPDIFYGSIGMIAFKRVEKERNCKFPPLETALSNLRGQALLMIHGEKDSYIRPTMAQSLFRKSMSWWGGKREFWLVEGARHNEGLSKKSAEYSAKVSGFLDRYLGEASDFPSSK